MTTKAPHSTASPTHAATPTPIPAAPWTALSPRQEEKLAALAEKRARYVPWRTAHADRKERWAMQAELRKVLRYRTGRKWAVVLKRTAQEADFTITFHAHWYRQPTETHLQQVAALLGKEWHGNCVGLTRAEAETLLSSH